MAKNGGNTEGFSISSAYGGILRKTEAVATLTGGRGGEQGHDADQEPQQGGGQLVLLWSGRGRCEHCARQELAVVAGEAGGGRVEREVRVTRAVTAAWAL